MASNKEYLDFILEQLTGIEDISYRAMMGEYILYYKNKVIGGLYDNRFLLKITESSEKIMPNAKIEIPYEGAKGMLLVDDSESKELLADLFEKMYEELSMPKIKKKK
jgi:tfoX N-domain family protein